MPGERCALDARREFLDAIELFADSHVSRLFQGQQAPFDVKYRYRPAEYGPNLVRLYILRNDEASSLGSTPLPDGVMRDLYVYEFDAQLKMRRFTYARSASYVNEQWRLQDLIENVLTDDGVSTRPVPARVWESFVSPGQLRVLFLPPEELSPFARHNLKTAFGQVRTSQQALLNRFGLA